GTTSPYSRRRSIRKRSGSFLKARRLPARRCPAGPGAVFDAGIDVSATFNSTGLLFAIGQQRDLVAAGGGARADIGVAALHGQRRFRLDLGRPAAQRGPVPPLVQSQGP